MSEQQYGVFLHSTGTQGGYVVRTMYDGWVPQPYDGRNARRVYRRRHAAQAHADKLNTQAAI